MHTNGEQGPQPLGWRGGVENVRYRMGYVCEDRDVIYFKIISGLMVLVSLGLKHRRTKITGLVYRGVSGYQYALAQQRRALDGEDQGPEGI